MCGSAFISSMSFRCHVPLALLLQSLYLKQPQAIILRLVWIDILNQTSLLYLLPISPTAVQSVTNVPQFTFSWNLMNHVFFGGCSGVMRFTRVQRRSPLFPIPVWTPKAALVQEASHSRHVTHFCLFPSICGHLNQKIKPSFYGNCVGNLVANLRLNILVGWQHQLHTNTFTVKVR